MLRLISFFALVACGLAANVDNCSWGESHWCSSLENAKTCGAFQHCKDTVWKNQVLKQDDSEICQFCKTIVDDVASYLKENKTEQEIQGFLLNACQMIPIKSLSEECQTLTLNYLPEVIELISDMVTPQVVCSLIKLCSGMEDTVVHPEPLVPAVADPPHRIRTKLSPLPIQSEPICTDCKKFFTDIKNLIVSNATEEEVETLINQNLCIYLGSYEQMCRDLVKQYLPEIMDLLVKEFDPNMVCQSFGFCSQSLPDAKNFLLKLKLKKTDFYRQTSSQNSAEGCDICKLVMKDLQDFDRSAAIQNEIKNFLKKEVCHRLGKYEATCTALIDTYGELVFEFLASELDPDTRCRSLGFCAADNVIRTPVSEAAPSKAPVAAHGNTSPQCILCEFVMKELDDILKKNATEEEIIAALEKVCSLLPASIKDSCDDFVKTYGKAIFEMLVQELSPDVICAALGLCSSAEEKPIPQPDSNSIGCTICETVVQYVEAIIEENSTTIVIERAVEKVCNFLPHTMKEECDHLIEKYGSVIINFISMEFTPKQVCKFARLCKSDVAMIGTTVEHEVERKVHHQQLGTLECSWGPSHWCASRTNAEKCGATVYCEQNGWNF